MAVIQEESFHEREEESRKPKEHLPLEKQKSSIIETLSKMTNSMNTFTTDVEGRIGEVIKSVGGMRKYGIDQKQVESGSVERMTRHGLNRHIKNNSDIETMIVAPKIMGRPPIGASSTVKMPTQQSVEDLMAQM